MPQRIRKPTLFSGGPVWRGILRLPPLLSKLASTKVANTAQLEGCHVSEARCGLLLISSQMSEEALPEFHAFEIILKLHF